MADGSPEGICGSGPYAPEIGPEHGERHLDRVQIRGVMAAGTGTRRRAA